MQYAFVTVGTTRFDALVSAVLTPEFAHLCVLRGVAAVRVQCGNSLYSVPPSARVQPVAVARDERAADSLTVFSLPLLHEAAGAAAVTFEVYRFKPSIELDLGGAAFVVSHAGAGSIMETLRQGRPLLVIVNESLADNHQEELAQAMATSGHCCASTVSGLLASLASADFAKRVPLPPAAPGLAAFAAALHDAL